MNLLTDWGVSEPEARELLRQQMCPACGNGPWKSPLTHAAKAHGIDRFTMRDACGINTNESVVEEGLRELFSDRGKNHGRDMREVASAPRKKYRQTKAGRAALTANLASVTADQSRAALIVAKSPAAQAKRSATLRAAWAALTPEERAQRTERLRRDPADLSDQATAMWDRRGRQPCGTLAAYKRGCRCDDCRRAKAASRA